MRDAATKALRRPPWLKDALHGVWLGHPLHPGLAQVSYGCFTGAAVFDLTGDRRRVAARLIGCGIASAVPTAVAGLADYADGHEEQQRIGLVHAAANTAALLCYVGSLRRRVQGRPGGPALALLGYGLMSVSALIGGDLAFRWAVGPNHAAEVYHSGPADWTDIGAMTEFTPDKPERRLAGLIPVMVVVSGGGVAVLHDRCSHMAAPLYQGEIVQRDGARCVQCPWHGSVFRLTDGAVVNGPATAPQPVLETRIENDRLQVRVPEIPGVPAS